MDGMVVEVNLEQQLVAVDTLYGFTIFEQLRNGDFESGDHVSWPDAARLGAGLAQNLSKRCRCEVYFLNHGVALAMLKVNMHP